MSDSERRRTRSRRPAKNPKIEIALASRSRRWVLVLALAACRTQLSNVCDCVYACRRAALARVGAACPCGGPWTVRSQVRAITHVISHLCFLSLCQCAKSTPTRRTLPAIIALRNANVLRRMPPALAPGAASPAHAQGAAARSLAIVGVELGGRDLRVVRPADLRSVQVLPSDAHHLRAFALEARRWEGGPTVAEGLADACSAQIGGGDQRTLLRRVTEAPLDGLLPALGCTCAEANSAGWSDREG